MSALIGTTANHEEYSPYLEAMGAAEAKDNVYDAICYCSITTGENVLATIITYKRH